MFTLLFLCFTVVSGHARISERSVQDFSLPATCMNRNFNMEEYLQLQSAFYKSLNTEKHGVQMMWNGKIENFFTSRGRSAQKSVGAGHSWTAIGAGNRCLNNPIGRADQYDPNGCVPFSNVIEKFQNLKTCLFQAQIGQPNGNWMKSKNDQFNYYSLSNDERIITRLAMLADKEVAGSAWRSHEALRGIFQPFEEDDAIVKVLSCVDYAHMDRNDLRCWSPLMGAPGYTGVTLLDHAPIEEKVSGAANPVVSQSCDVPPACGRIGLEHLHQFQSVYYAANTSSWFSSLRRSSNVDNEKEWVKVRGVDTMPTFHEACMLKPSQLGSSICWQYSECIGQMMKYACAKHAGCCPSFEVHDICRIDVSNPQCKVCQKPKPWYQFW